jgi:hypothetical protein
MKKVFFFFVLLAMCRETPAQQYFFESEGIPENAMFIPDSVKHPGASREQNIDAWLGKEVIMNESKNYEYPSLFKHQLVTERTYLFFSKNTGKNVLHPVAIYSSSRFAWEILGTFLYYLIFSFLVRRSIWQKRNPDKIVTDAVTAVAVIAAGVAAGVAIVVVVAGVAIAGFAIAVVAVAAAGAVADTDRANIIMYWIFILVSTLGTLIVSYYFDAYGFALACIAGHIIGFAGAQGLTHYQEKQQVTE